MTLEFQSYRLINSRFQLSFGIDFYHADLLLALCCWVTLVVSNSVRPHRRQLTRLLSLGFSRQEQWSGLPFPSPIHEREKSKWSRSVISDLATPWTAAYQAPPSIGFSRQEYWSGLPLPSPILFTSKDIKSVIKNFPTKKAQDQMVSLLNSTKN